MANDIQSSKNLDEAYQAHIAEEKIKVSRIMCLLGALLYLAFALIDVFSLTSSLAQVLLVRGVVILGVIAAYASTYQDYFIKYYNHILSAVYLSATAGIEIMIYLAIPEDHASKVYFVGLLLVIMTVFAWSYFKLEITILVTLTIIVSYAFVEIQSNQMEFTAVFVNIFFLISAASIGFVSQIMRDRYLRENFLLHQSLEEKVVEKTKEAETHEHLANHDQLTGLANSRYAKDRLEKNLQRAKQLDMSMVIMYLDLNGFKQVNDIYGHRAGDEVLRIVGKRLKSCVRNGDCLARLGGDEFGIGLLVEKHELGIAQEIREKIEKVIAQPIGFEGNVLQIGTSVGMASYPASGDKVSVLIEIADKRMYNAKQEMKKRSAAKNSTPSKEDTEFNSEVRAEPVVIFPG